MTLASRHGASILVSAALLAAIAACDGGETSSEGTGGDAGAPVSGTGATGTGGSDGGLFQTNDGGTTSTGTGTTTTSTPVDPSAPCKSDETAMLTSAWAKQAGGAQVQAALGVTTDASGNVIVAGNFTGTIDLGAGVLSSAGQNDAFVAKLAAAGTTTWSKSYGDGGYHQYAQHVATDAQGNVLVAGHFRGTINFGGGALSDASNFFEDIFIAKLDGANGGHIWSKRYGDINTEEAQDITTDASGNVIVAGAFQKSVNFGGGALTAEDDGFNGFIAKLTPAGDQVWAKSIGDTATEQKTMGVTADADGNVYIVGYHQGAVDLGMPFTANAGEQNAFVAKLSPAGAYLWARSWPSVGAAALDAGVDATGNVYVIGNFKGKMSFGGKEFDAGVANDVFVVKLDKSGDHLWSRAFGSAGAADEATSLELDAGKPVVFGAFTKEINFGGGALLSGGGYDVFLAKLDEEGCQIHAAVYGGEMLQRGETLAVDKMGNIVFAGSFDGVVDFGGGAFTSNATDAYIAKLKP